MEPLGITTHTGAKQPCVQVGSGQMQLELDPPWDPEETNLLPLSVRLGLLSIGRDLQHIPHLYKPG